MEQAHIQRWKATCKRLRAPLPIGEGGAGLATSGLMTPGSRRTIASSFQVWTTHCTRTPRVAVVYNALSSLQVPTACSVVLNWPLGYGLVFYFIALGLGLGLAPQDVSKVQEEEPESEEDEVQTKPVSFITPAQQTWVLTGPLAIPPVCPILFAYGCLHVAVYPAVALFVLDGWMHGWMDGCLLHVFVRRGVGQGCN